ncbi:pilus assembly protein [Noviherbaspirillum denitrificans]|uniref:Pilus assembly protein PilY n=1 Tax=Noviherbaspirillum denitrificans TaxID=1968433 RepID=A0A254TGT5_9BURK|nr:PilC/PilY family type IV pilus protein [Noviherbaspirillum denitrificans]OWW21866.1 pilus assembly protein PilY [Noviherbaspirillum denitrificans]
MSKNLYKIAAATALLGFHMSVPAEDIDLFVGASTSASEVPNVLFIVDNTANWNTAFTNEIAALANTLAGLPVNKFRVGMMFAVETGGVNNNVDGGYVRAAMRLMDSDNKTKYQALVNSLDKLKDKGNGGTASLVMAEAYRYFSGGAPNGGNGKGKTDYTGNTLSDASGGTAASRAVWALTGNALSSKDATSYISPVTSGCQKNYIIYISNGPSNDNSSILTKSASMLSAAGGSTTQIPISPAGSQSNVSDEWARFMKQSPYGVVTYTIDVNPGTTGQGPGWTALLKSMSTVSGGTYAAVSTASGSTALQDAMNKALSEIQSVNSVFAAVSLPVSVNTQGTYLNQVFVGMFRPDASDRPRWAGNLKQYKMGFSGDALRLLDADSNTAINSQTGFIAECARSYWTPDKGSDSYWSFQPQGKCIPPGSATDLYMNSNSPDGNIVEKGAQAYKQRQAAATRTVKTCSTSFSACTSMTNFDTANAAITQAALGAASSSERDALINWARGTDLNDEDIDGDVAEKRPSLHGDVVHSRPVAINYGSDASPQVVVFYGGNDGILRAVNGNRTAAIGSVEAGRELWSFVAPESYANFKRIRDNTVAISTPTVAGSPKPYGFDGAITAYQSGANTWLYATMRRGGRAMYAFNVSDPANPILKWKIGCPSPTGSAGCTTNFERMGQTWSSAKVMKAAGYGSGNAPILIMGGGYDPCEDSDPNSCASPSMGNRIYVLDADTGAWLASLNTDRAVTGDVTIVRNRTTGLATYAYATDLGGNVYRITIGNAAPAGWTITKIASLGCDSPATCANNRKFMFGPNVVEEDNGVYVVMAGSGDREKPLLSYASAAATQNYFFMIKDKPSDAAWLTSESANCTGTAVMCKNSLLAIPASSNPSTADLAGKKGWYLPLAPTEQVVTSAITLIGVVTFSTHKPAVSAPGSCSANLGQANVYNIRYTDASPVDGTTRSQRIAGDGLPPSPVGGKVTLDDGRTVPFIIGSKASSPLEANEPSLDTPSTSTQTKNRVYWYIQH